MSLREKLMYVAEGINWDDVVGWISVEDRLPEPGVPVRVWQINAGKQYDNAWRTGRDWYSENNRFIGWSNSGVTHWQPMPKEATCSAACDTHEHG